MKKIVVGVFLVFVVTFLSVSVAGVGSNQANYQAQSMGTNWLSGWTYRKVHNITGSTAGNQINYPITMSIRYGHGLDNQGEVYLGGKCRADFGDTVYGFNRRQSTRLLDTAKE